MGAPCFPGPPGERRCCGRWGGFSRGKRGFPSLAVLGVCCFAASSRGPSLWLSEAAKRTIEVSSESCQRVRILFGPARIPRLKAANEVSGTLPPGLESLAPPHEMRGLPHTKSLSWSFSATSGRRSKERLPCSANPGHDQQHADNDDRRPWNPIPDWAIDNSDGGIRRIIENLDNFTAMIAFSRRCAPPPVLEAHCLVAKCAVLDYGHVSRSYSGFASRTRPGKALSLKVNDGSLRSCTLED